ncbi:MAG: KH domain-containing protein [Verrucomicrobiota bacterium]
MDEFLRYVVRHLIENPDEMVLTHTENPRKVVFRLKLRPSEVGKVIGKQGRTITAIRNLLSAGAARHGQKALLQIDE